MNPQCPLCQAAWPAGDSPYAVCPACFGGFRLDGGRWIAIPPSSVAASPPPFALNTPLLLRGRACRVAGFASFSCQIEHDREHYEIYHRHLYALSDGRLLCWGWGQWWLARAVDSSLAAPQPGDWNRVVFEGLEYRRHAGQSFSMDRASGLLPYPLRWHETHYIQDFIAGPFAPGPGGGRILMGEPSGPSHTAWAGECIAPGEVLEAFALREFPAASTYREASAAAAPPAAMPLATPPRSAPSQLPRLLASIAAVAALFAVVGAGAFLYERRSKAVASQWFACPTGPAGQRIEAPTGAARVELDPHLPQGALRIDAIVVDASGAALISRSDFLDLSAARRAMALKLPFRAAAVRVGCSLAMPIAGLRSWPVEIRFLR